MSLSFHLLRPLWLLGFIPLIMLMWVYYRHSQSLQTWRQCCDPHLLVHLAKTNTAKTRHWMSMCLFSLFLSLLCGLVGPSFRQQPTPVFENQQARVVLLDLSSTMEERDLSPNRLQRAKFKLHDLFKIAHQGQFGFIVYTSEPFVVSPLTDDAQTIEALLGSIKPSIMPVYGNRLELALDEAQQLIQQAGLKHGDILIMTGETPTPQAINTAEALAKSGITTSIIPFNTQLKTDAFAALTTVGAGRVYPLTNTPNDIQRWLHDTNQHAKFAEAAEVTSAWRDDGRGFLIPALIIMLFLFQRDWLRGLGA